MRYSDRSGSLMKSLKDGYREKRQSGLMEQKEQRQRDKNIYKKLEKSL